MTVFNERKKIQILTMLVQQQLLLTLVTIKINVLIYLTNVHFIRRQFTPLHISVNHKSLVLKALRETEGSYVNWKEMSFCDL